MAVSGDKLGGRVTVPTANPVLDRNTSLPHPEAKFGPDACISEEDVNPTRALLRYRMSFTAQRELQGRSSALHDRTPSSSSDEGALTALGRLAVSSLRHAELPKLAEGLDAFLSSKDTDSIASSDGVIGRSPSESPMQNGREFDQPKAEPRDGVRDHRDGQPRDSLVKRLMHR